MHETYEAGAAGPRNRIDELVFGRLQSLGLRPANLSSDAVFLRRAFLDVTGTLPAAAEAAEFLADRAEGKRGLLIERLLESEEFLTGAAN